jgi:MFS family permease
MPTRDNAGVGIAVQCGPLFLSEIAPYHLRGAFNTQFQLFITIGILLAQCINYANQDFEWGWRLNLSLAAVPALLLMVGAALVPDTPNSLVERGQEGKGKAMLRKIRGVDGEQAVLDSRRSPYRCMLCWWQRRCAAALTIRQEACLWAASTAVQVEGAHEQATLAE